MGFDERDQTTLSLGRIREVADEVFEEGKWNITLNAEFLANLLIACWERNREAKETKKPINLEALLKALVDDVYKKHRPKKVEVVDWGDPEAPAEAIQ